MPSFDDLSVQLIGKDTICQTNISDWAQEYLCEICAEHKMHLQGVSTVYVNKACVPVFNDQYSIPIRLQLRFHQLSN